MVTGEYKSPASSDSVFVPEKSANYHTPGSFSTNNPFRRFCRRVTYFPAFEPLADGISDELKDGCWVTQDFKSCGGRNTDNYSELTSQFFATGLGE